IGLQQLGQEGKTVSLGVNGKTLLQLLGDASLSRLDPRAAGLFHTAFLLPRREDLGSWLGFVAANRIPLQGASDHIVSEAIYLADPEGNGIEVYADRDPKAWQDPSGGIRMSTDPLDLQGLMEASEGTRW